MAQITKELDLNRKGLYTAFSPQGNPSFVTVARVLDIAVTGAIAAEVFSNVISFPAARGRDGFIKIIRHLLSINSI